MSKAILVIDMPDSCKDCDIMFKGDYSDWCPWKDARTDVYDYIKNNTKPDWCPLQEIEERPYDHIWDMYLDEFEDYCQHGDVYAINDDGTVGEKIGTCSILKRVIKNEVLWWGKL